MIISIIIGCAAIFYVVGVLNGFMDDLQFNPNSWLAKFKFFNPALSALNKWEILASYPVLENHSENAMHNMYNGVLTQVVIGSNIYYKENNYNKLWYYLWLYKPDYKEAFPYSTTFLVFITQGWHLLKFAMFQIIGFAFTFLLIYSKVIPDDWYYCIVAPVTVFIFRGLGFITVNRIAQK